MKRFSTCIALASMVLTAIIPADALAQRTGTRMGRNALKPDAEEVSALVSKCMVERRGAIVARILETLPGSSAEGRVLISNEGALGVCMSDDKLVSDGRTLYFDPQGLRLHLALAAARKALVDAGPAPVLSTADAPWYVALLNASKERERIDQSILALQEIGDCLLKREAQGGMDLIRSAENTPDQGKAMRKLLPHLSACVVVGQEIEITPAVVRFAIAEPLLNRLSPQKGPSA